MVSQKVKKTISCHSGSRPLGENKLQLESSFFNWLQNLWTLEPAPDFDPGFTGVTTFYETLNRHLMM